MNSLAPTDPRLFRLVWAVCDGTATAAERTQLEAALAESDTLCDLYLRYTAMHVELMWQGQEADSAERWREILGPEIAEHQNNASLTLSRPATAWWQRWLSLPELGATLAAGILFALYIVVISQDLPKTNHPAVAERSHSATASLAASDPDTPPSANDALATCDSLPGAQWADASRAAAPDAPPAMQLDEPLRLLSGMAKVQLKSGATLLIAGPADWALKGENHVALTRGRLVAQVPRQATGFTVVTPTARFVDLGTEFGVLVDEASASHLHVFRGKVLGQPRGVGSPGTAAIAPIEIGASQAMIATGDGQFTVEQSAEPLPELVGMWHELTPAADLVRDDVLAHWRFENATPAATGTRTQHTVITDASGHLQELDYWPGQAGRYASSSEVPPASMFAPGYGGGEHSFHSGGLVATAEGVLFHDSLRQGDTFTFGQDFTIEGYFKTDGDQSAVGPMTLLFKSRFVPQWEVELNVPTPGAMAVVLTGGGQQVQCSAGGSDSSTPQAKNLADGAWHYFAVRGWRGEGRLALTVGHEDGTSQTAIARIPDGFRFDPTSDRRESNLFVGRKTHMMPIQGHFAGLIDEVRISSVARDDAALLFPVSPEPTLKR